jgi:hypothetical protein
MTKGGKGFGQIRERFFFAGGPSRPPPTGEEVCVLFSSPVGGGREGPPGFGLRLLLPIKNKQIPKNPFAFSKASPGYNELVG